MGGSASSGRHTTSPWARASVSKKAGTVAQPRPRLTSASTIADGSDVQLGIGETARLADGSRLSYLRLVNDSRCLPGVQCVWAGDAEIALRWQPASGRAQELALHTASLRGSDVARIGERSVTLVALERGIAPRASLRIDKAD